MKKIIVIAFLLFVVAPPVRADASTVEEQVSVFFIANPNLPQSPAPGIPPDGNPVQVTISKGSLPKTGEKQSSLLPLGMVTMIIAAFLLLQKKKDVI
ncbi:LPXTG cell wall anchor domain-containing protein [Lactococcus allomyrinae]|uniref:LPXTG cell wall anchor domain-containing protein n=1 Tax=Lactococcus allomyrinae TaxID=2419773 RepID=A0A387BEB1_9LACT|nr:LPXTG cell wall anchor domain-containing protein [Lactococcus allomyrinae]AYG00402.1 LPXTG cell wall anchor domain-containing protein [Lactococcus allomyrinae]